MGKSCSLITRDHQKQELRISHVENFAAWIFNAIKSGTFLQRDKKLRLSENQTA